MDDARIKLIFALEFYEIVYLFCRYAGSIRKVGELQGVRHKFPASHLKSVPRQNITVYSVGVTSESKDFTHHKAVRSYGYNSPGLR